MKKLKNTIIEALEKFKDFNNNTYPKRIILYRDGVSEGERTIIM